MRRQINMIAVILLLCAVELHCSHGIAAQNQCASNPEAACFKAFDYLNVSGSVSVDVFVGKTLVISLEHLSKFPICQWIKGADTILTVNGSSSISLSALSETDSGEFTLSCESSEGNRTSLAVSLRVVRKRPTKPKLTLSNVEDPVRSPLFTCSSEGFPKPTLEWRGKDKFQIFRDGKDVPAKGSMAISQISSANFDSEAMCCATNAEGQECSRLYDYNLDPDKGSNEVSTAILSPGQSLLLRCRIKRISRETRPDWENSSRVGTKISACSSQAKEICTTVDVHNGFIMSYLLIESAYVHHSGTYTCRTDKNQTKSVDIRVQAEGLVSVELDESRIISAANASHCLQATVSYHHVLQQCSWEAPDKKVTKCQRDTWVTHHRIVKLCDVLKSGDYILHLEADGQNETKTISVCVVDPPKFQFRNHKSINALTVETATLVPANYTWMVCPKERICDTASHWTAINDASQTDSAVACTKTIKSSLCRDQVAGQHLKFCVTNSVGSWCEIPSPHPSKSFTERPTKPKLTLSDVEDDKKNPLFICSTESCPKPTLEWRGKDTFQIFRDGKDVPAKGLMVISQISSANFDSEAMCCATNAEGQECSRLYDYNLDTDVGSNEVSTAILSPGQSLLLRCRMKRIANESKLIANETKPDWENSSRVGTKISACSSQAKEICTTVDIHNGFIMSYLLIESAYVHHSGTYTCRTDKNQTKSVDIRVQAEGLVSVELDESRIISAANASHCLQATVSYHHVLQQCSWEAPDKKVTKCQRDTWVTHHRIVKLCDVLKSGDYILHLEADGQKETKTISVCVVDPPKFQFRLNESENSFTFETATLVPAIYTWMVCPKEHNVTDCYWTEIKNASQRDSAVACTKTIKSSLCRDQVVGQHLKFCVTNSVGSWCEIQSLHYQHLPSLSMSSTVSAKDDDGSFMVLKVGSLILLLALAVVSVVLMYFIKKKKPRYQPHLQIIQTVGPNDNDYIYINFNEFEYDLKWEFPRENLELGQELGSGAFGTVVQATAYGISKPGVSQQVAVKMLKEKHQTLEKEALMSELKMLTHIGHHANIVNLLGACTDSGPTYLIFQYCCHGDLLNYLKTNRQRYHKSATDAFNKIRFSSLFHHKRQPGRSSGMEDSAVGDYMPMYGSATRGQEDIALLAVNSGDMDSYEDEMIDDDPDEQTDDLQILTFDDLLNFAFQVAKGMEFLSSKNCIHRDLAARNVLVTKGRRVKIGDFGLARDIENDSNYVVRGNVRLPVKWMAPESTFQGIYTIKSDVWAYGILLWEIFSLGVTPYPGMKVDHLFYSMIERGFKMDCPYYANESVYRMMCKCWSLDPSNRPSFSKLVSLMYDWLTDREEKLYHNTFDQTSGDYQNAATILDISAMAKQGENQTQPANDYRGIRATEEGKDAASDAEAAGEKLVRPPDPE